MADVAKVDEIDALLTALDMRFLTQAERVRLWDAIQLWVTTNLKSWPLREQITIAARLCGRIVEWDES